MLERLLRTIIREGALVVRGPDGKTYATGGVTEENAPLIVHIRDHATLARIARHPGLAAGEAYMDGGLTIERGALYDFMALTARNLKHLPKRKRGWRAFLHRRNRRKAARRNVAHHYDLSGALFELSSIATANIHARISHIPG